MRKNQPVSHLMTRDPVTLHLGQKPSEMQSIFAANRFHHLPAAGEYHALPVTDGDGNLKGIVTSTDLIRYLGEQLA
jgi:CBS domain-containing protein